MLKESTYQTPCGTIHYWSSILNLDTTTLVFLPGLTADHRLFDKQVAYFDGKYNIIVWDAPAHASSWPFRFDFDLFDKAKWLNGILEKEEIRKPIIIGQSMGGYVGQAYAQLYPDRLAGFISIDSAPLQRNYVTAVEIWLLKRMEPVYAHYPWKLLLKSGTEGVAASNYGRNLMKEMMLVYDGDQHRYAQIAGHGFRILAEAMEKDLPYEIKSPSLLICGTKDHAGSCLLIIKPIIIGQSMGGYVGQAYAQLYPGRLAGFISIDSAPLQRNYVTAVEIWLLKRMEPVYAHYPWKVLLKSGTEGVAASNYGRNLMKEMMLVYDGDQHRYAQIAGHGFRILAEAMEKDLPYEIKCPSRLICGTKDHAGSCIRYNREWHRKTKIPLKWIEGAGHNSNTDKPEMINSLLEEFFSNIL